MTDKGGERSQTVPEEMGTLFIMDLVRQKREKAMREKKDAMILQMALAQKEKMAQKNKESNVRSFSGGFVGINQLKTGTPVWTPRKKQREEEKTPEHHTAQSENELFILGLLKEQKQQLKNKEKVSEESLACASDAVYRQKFERWPRDASNVHTLKSAAQRQLN